MPLYSERQISGRPAPAPLRARRRAATRRRHRRHGPTADLLCAAREARAGGETHVTSTKLIRCGTLFDATGAQPLRDAAVVVADGRITVTGPAATTPAPGGAEVVDWSDRFVMPGLIDCHSHASIVPGLGDQLGQLCRGPVPQALAATANLRRDLAAGTTTMRIMGEEHFLDLELREAVAAGIVPGPRLLVAGRGLAANNGHGRALAGYDGVDEVRRGARENLRRGADHVKIFVT